MRAQAPLAADVVASNALLKAAREYAASELVNPFTSEGQAKLELAATVYVQAVKDAKRARRMER